MNQETDQKDQETDLKDRETDQHYHLEATINAANATVATPASAIFTSTSKYYYRLRRGNVIRSLSANHASTGRGDTTSVPKDGDPAISPPVRVPATDATPNTAAPTSSRLPQT